MKHTQIIAGCIWALSGLAACTGGAEKTAENKADTIVAKAIPMNLFSLSPGDLPPGSDNPSLAVAPIYFGILPTIDPLAGCNPGPGICKMGIGKPRDNTDTLQVIEYTFTARMSKANLQNTNPALYDSLHKNGVISFEDNFLVPTSICQLLGNTTGITMINGSPIVLMPPGSDTDDMVGMAFYGAIPGNRADINLSNCAGQYSCDISFSRFNTSGRCPGYTSFHMNEDGSSGILVIYMQTASVISQIDCVPVPTSWQNGLSSAPFSPASQFNFTDTTIANSMSVPHGWVIPQGAGNGTPTIFFYPSGWCSLQLYVTQSQGGGDDAEKK